MDNMYKVDIQKKGQANFTSKFDTLTPENFNTLGPVSLIRHKYKFADIGFRRFGTYKAFVKISMSLCSSLYIAN